MGGSTYGVGGNLELINDTFGIRTTDDFPIGSRNGVIKFSLGGDFTNANTRVKFTPTGAIFGAAVGLISAGAELDVRGAAKIATDLTLTTGDITQTNNVVVNIITATSAGSLSEFAYYNDTGIRGQLLMGGSTYGVGGNLELINNTFGIRTTDDFPIGSRNGDIKFSLGADFTNANTRAKLTSTGAIFGAAVGLVSAGAELHVKGSGSTDSTTAILVQNLLGADLLEVKDGGSMTINGEITQEAPTVSGRTLFLTGQLPADHSLKENYNGGWNVELTRFGAVTARLSSSLNSIVQGLEINGDLTQAALTPSGRILHDVAQTPADHKLEEVYLGGWNTEYTRFGVVQARIASSTNSWVGLIAGANFGVGIVPTGSYKFEVLGDALIDGNTTLDGNIIAASLPVYADEAAAIVGGIATDTIYKTSTGEIRIKL